MNDKKITSMIFKTLNYTNEIKKKSTKDAPINLLRGGRKS